MNIMKTYNTNIANLYLQFLILFWYITGARLARLFFSFYLTGIPYVLHCMPFLLYVNYLQWMWFSYLCFNIVIIISYSFYPRKLVPFQQSLEIFLLHSIASHDVLAADGKQLDLGLKVLVKHILFPYLTEFWLAFQIMIHNIFLNITTWKWSSCFYWQSEQRKEN